MGINKVVLGETTLIDLTSDTVTVEKMLSGTTAHDKTGTAITGTIATKTSSNLTASGATVSVPAGYYASAASKSVSTATQATPTISVSTAGLITASATQTAGYVTAGTKSATKQLTTQAAQTITPGTANKTIASGRYLTGTQTIKGDSNLKAANIKSGVSIFGVAGSYTGATTAYAAIGVTYPSGSTCTCTNGTTTYTAPDTTGQCVFIISSNGTWTVTATDGTNTKSQSVSITTEGQFESVELNYRHYLYNSGTQNVPWSQGSGGSGALVFNSDHMLIQTNGYPTWASTSSKQSRGKYTKLGVTCVLSSSPNDGVWIGVTTDNSNLATNMQSKFIASKVLTTSGEQTATVDISSVTVDAYITIMGMYNSGNTEIKAVWFE